MNDIAGVSLCPRHGWGAASAVGQATDKALREPGVKTPPFLALPLPLCQRLMPVVALQLSLFQRLTSLLVVLQQ